MDANGLEGVVVADTALSDVDGERGRLVIRGHDVEALALAHDFEAVCALLWSGALPGAAAHAALRAALGRGRVHAFARLGSLGDALAAADAMDALRAALAHLRAGEIAAAWARRHAGQASVAPDPSLGHAADFLRMAGAHADAGALPAGTYRSARMPALDARAQALDAYLVAAADHGMNASTFTARVVASTHSDAVSAVVAALGALKGPLHGGAPGPVLEMLDAIGTPDRAASWIAGELAAGRRIMGMGHRVYRVRDPRAAVLERAVERLRAAAGPGLAGTRLELARAVEAVAVASLGERRPERRLAANVEFYTAVILDAVGLPPALFSATFAVARVAGWLAHIDEQLAGGRLIRPASRYVGPRPTQAAAVPA
ncbi:MAG: citrate synthase [Nitrospira sp.]|nr:citrate synthase [Nitrospira sp.]